MADENPETPETLPDENLPTEPLEKEEKESGTPGEEEKPDKKPTPIPKQPLGEGDKGISPTASGEELPEGELDKIITRSLDILQSCQKEVDEQKIDSSTMAFMLIKIRESLDSYCEDYIPKLNTFLVNANEITADYYARMCCSLPKYGDYVKVIEAEQSDPIAAGGDHPVGKRQLHGLVKNVTDNYHAAAVSLKSARDVLKDLNNTTDERKGKLCNINTLVPNWIKIQDNINHQLESIREESFKSTAYIDFLKQGETKTEKLSLDEKKLLI